MYNLIWIWSFIVDIGRQFSKSNSMLNYKKWIMRLECKSRHATERAQQRQSLYVSDSRKIKGGAFMINECRGKCVDFSIPCRPPTKGLQTLTSRGHMSLRHTWVDHMMTSSRRRSGAGNKPVTQWKTPPINWLKKVNPREHSTCSADCNIRWNAHKFWN